MIRSLESENETVQLFSIRPMDRDVAQQIDRWRYPPPYDFYNLDQDEDDRVAFLDPNNWPGKYYAVVHQHYGLTGFYAFEFVNKDVTLGLGMHPNLTGQGLGVAFVTAGINVAKTHYQACRIELSVANFNQRAIRVYERCGFVAEDSYKLVTNGGEHDFLRMSLLV